jgi:hypothetical protein
MFASMVARNWFGTVVRKSVRVRKRERGSAFDFVPEKTVFEKVTSWGWVGGGGGLKEPPPRAPNPDDVGLRGEAMHDLTHPNSMVIYDEDAKLGVW